MDNSILIFRTSISTMDDMERIGKIINERHSITKWSVDLEDWEKVLRIECSGITAFEIIQMLEKINITASELE